MRPAEPDQVAAAVTRLMTFGRAFGLLADDLALAAAIYRDTLADLPPAVLAEAIERTIRSWRYRRLPQPADIRAHAEEIMDGWLTAMARLQTLGMALRWQHDARHSSQAGRLMASEGLPAMQVADNS